MISTRCCTPTGRIADDGVGVDLEAETIGHGAHVRASGGEVEDTEALGVLVTEHDVLGDGEDRHEHEVLVHHADTGAHGVTGSAEVLDDVVEEDVALVGLIEAVEDVHEGRLAGAVLPEESVDLARPDDEVDVIVGDQGAEALGDAPEFELHVGQSMRRMVGGQRSGPGNSRSPAPTTHELTESSASPR
ncbi:hypothetical protein QE411_000145 [Microbacterium arborescens]|nr:hypothetical protein [Microbacterium arborescens]